MSPDHFLWGGGVSPALPVQQLSIVLRSSASAALASDENGNCIVGYGVSGTANIVVTPDHVEFGSARSEPFSPEAKAALAELRKTLANC